jgi:hypothetical protein
MMSAARCRSAAAAQWGLAQPVWVVRSGRLAHLLPELRVIEECEMDPAANRELRPPWRAQLRPTAR